MHLCQCIAFIDCTSKFREQIELNKMFVSGSEFSDYICVALFGMGLSQRTLLLD